MQIAIPVSEGENSATRKGSRNITETEINLQRNELCFPNMIISYLDRLLKSTESLIKVSENIVDIFYSN